LLITPTNCNACVVNVAVATGTASRRAEQTTLEARNDGSLKFINLQTVLNKMVIWW
jgi:hypothetical protein